jgi:hypothetical protein
MKKTYEKLNVQFINQKEENDRLKKNYEKENEKQKNNIQYF